MAISKTHTREGKFLPKLNNPHKADRDKIAAIVDRALAADPHRHTRAIDRPSLVMDVCDVHANTCALDLDLMLKANTPDEHVRADVFGIRRFIDRDNAQLLQGFRPRFAKEG